MICPFAQGHIVFTWQGCNSEPEKFGCKAHAHIYSIRAARKSWKPRHHTQSHAVTSAALHRHLLLIQGYVWERLAQWMWGGCLTDQLVATWETTPATGRFLGLYHASPTLTLWASRSCMQLLLLGILQYIYCHWPKEGVWFRLWG